MYKHTLCIESKQAIPDTQTQNTLPGMCQGEEEFSKSLHFYWKLRASPPTYNAVCTPRNQHCLNLWYFNKPSCQAKDVLRHITFVQRRIPAAAKSRECQLCCKPTHRYVKRVLLKITALRTAWSRRGHRLFRECTWEWQIATKNPFTAHRGKWGSTNECLFFISYGQVGKSRLLGLGCTEERNFLFFSRITIRLHYSVTQASLETECHWVMAGIDEFSWKIYIK